VQTAKLERFPSTDEGTFGLLTYGAEVTRTLELPWRENRKNESCIPAGVYTVAWLYSPKFGFCYGVTGVPGRGNILIHAANFAGDVTKGFQSQLHGCIAPYTRDGKIRNSSGVMQRAGLLSRPALLKLQAWGDTKPFQLEIS
jgi:Family of unknown function (DUF5675)